MKQHLQLLFNCSQPLLVISACSWCVLSLVFVTKAFTFLGILDILIDGPAL